MKYTWQGGYVENHHLSYEVCEMIAAMLILLPELDEDRQLRTIKDVVRGVIV